MFALLPTGTPVFDRRFGWGKIGRRKQAPYQVTVHFENYTEQYTSRGTVYKHLHPVLSLTQPIPKVHKNDYTAN